MKPLELNDVELQINGKTLVGPLSCTVDTGTVTSVIGPSGSGKSSLLSFLCGVLQDGIQASGTARIGDAELTSMRPSDRRLGLLFQDPLLFPHMSVAGNLLFGLRGAASRGEREERVENGLSAFGLAGFGPRDPATLSGGQQARVALLRVMLAEPRALLLDEPFSSLDDDNRQRVRQLVFDEAGQRGLPTLLVTHDRDDVDAAGGPVIDLRSASHA